jgi:hypothetical protein
MCVVWACVDLMMDLSLSFFFNMTESFVVP